MSSELKTFFINHFLCLIVPELSVTEVSWSLYGLSLCEKQKLTFEKFLSLLSRVNAVRYLKWFDSVSSQTARLDGFVQKLAAYNSRSHTVRYWLKYVPAETEFV